MNTFHPVGIACWLLVFCSFVGCGGDDEGARALVPVAGEVSLDDKPLPEGNIIFEPADSSVGAEGGKITDGKFSFQAPPGSSIVRITAERKTDKTETGAMGESIAVSEQYLPARFNKDSELKEEVPSDGKSDFKFELKGE